MSRKDSIALAREIHNDITAQRRDFHIHPELGFDLPRTAGVVASKLRELGLPVKTGIGRSGVVADLKSPDAKGWIALRADMDALPIQELSDVSYKSQTPMQAHLCGHDAHTSMLLGAAQILSSLKQELKVNVRFIFQPNEESWPGGAPEMIRDGVLENIDEIYALHVWPTLDVGRYGICVGPAMAQADAFEIVVKGNGGHAAAPHAAIDPILVATHVIQALQTIVSRNINPHDNVVLSVTQIHAGNCYNVIPDSCIISGTVRTYESNVQAIVKQKMESIAVNVAKGFGATVEVKYMEGYPVTFNHETSARNARDIASRLVGNHGVDYPAQRAMFGEDFGYYTQKIKGCFIQLGCRNEAKNITRMLHDPRFDIDEDCLIYGIALFLELILKKGDK